MKEKKEKKKEKKEKKDKKDKKDNLINQSTSIPSSPSPPISSSSISSSSLTTTTTTTIITNKKGIEVTTRDLKFIIHQMLNSKKEKVSFTVSSFTSEIEKKLQLQENSLTNRKGEIEGFMLNYLDLVTEIDSEGNEIETEEKIYESKQEKSKYKTGKWSKSESDIIRKAVYDYISLYNLELKDVFSHLRPIGYVPKKKSHAELWNYLREAIPNRNMNSISTRAVLCFNEVRNMSPFTDEDKQTLINLRAEGHSMMAISKLMNRYRVDICDFYKIMGRKKGGIFSEEEDQRVIDVVRKLCQIPDAIPVAAYPIKNIPWKLVAKELNHERIPLDYIRRWPAILRIATDKQVAHKKKLDLIEKEKIILRHLNAIGATDETEVTWSDIDKLHVWVQHFSLTRWKVMCKRMKFRYNVDFVTKLEILTETYNIPEQLETPETESNDPNIETNPPIGTFSEYLLNLPITSSQGKKRTRENSNYQENNNNNNNEIDEKERKRLKKEKKRLKKEKKRAHKEAKLLHVKKEKENTESTLVEDNLHKKSKKQKHHHKHD